MKRQMARFLLAMLLLASLLLSGCAPRACPATEAAPAPTQTLVLPDSTAESTATALSIPPYAGEAFVILDGNSPSFSEAEKTTVGYERYSRLDVLGRCGAAIASCGKEIMPGEGEKRGSISSIYPSGWVQAAYDHVAGKFLYNRSHLIGWQLSAENANEENLITGTRYFNVEGMLPFENMVADFIRETGFHVAYRVTPVYQGEELVPRGVRMEAFSVEDDGQGICFHVFVYNVQPGVEIDYATGRSRLTKEKEEAAATAASYVLNTKSKKIHLPTCDYAKAIKEENRSAVKGQLEDFLAQGYTTCGSCF